VSADAPGEGLRELRGAWIETPKQARERQKQASKLQHAQKRAQRNVSGLSLLLLLTVLALVAGLAFAMETTPYDFWGGFLVGSILLLLTLPIAARASKHDGDPQSGRIILLAVLVKLVIGTPARYVQSYYLYKAADATSYYNAGLLLIDQFRHWDFSDLGSLIGTRFIEVLSGITLAIIDQTRFGQFVVFSWLSFVGLYFFYRAFRIAFPEGDYKRYRLLLFFWPSLLFWPSSVGKDAWMVLALGMSALGVAQLLIGRFRGVAWLGVGSLACCMVRPHLALMVIAGFAMALVLRRTSAGYDRMLARPIGTAILMVGMIIVAAVLFSQAQAFFKLDSLDLESAQLVLQSTQAQTSEGGSQYTPADPTTPLGFGEATVTVLFRPFPFENPSGPGLVAGLEGLMLVGLAAVSFGRLVRTPRMMLRNPYVAFAVGYSFAFVFAFAAISNFGILARERSQLLPVLFVLFSIPKKSVDDEPEIAARPKLKTI
jgi:hypothetical protein